MGFKTKWVCEYCDNEIWASECPNEDECDCYVEPEVYIHDEMGSVEKKERYRLAYIDNNFSWDGKKPWMFLGKFGIYPDRNGK